MKKTILLFSVFTLAVLISACSDKKTTASAKKNQADEPVKDYYVEMVTNMGTIKLRLYNETPLHRDNFVKLVKESFFDSLLFHRVIKGFMIQGGDPDSRNAKMGQMLGEGDVGYTIPPEFNPALIHKKGALAAARDNNPMKASSGCQFYIVQGKPVDQRQLEATQPKNGWIYTPIQTEKYRTDGGTPQLDNAYTVFGEVVEGIEIVDLIAGVGTNGTDRPLIDVRILKCKLVKN